MEKSSYQKLRQKMEKIKKWLIIKDYQWEKLDGPEIKLLKKQLQELKEIVYEKNND